MSPPSIFALFKVLAQDWSLTGNSSPVRCWRPVMWGWLEFGTHTGRWSCRWFGAWIMSFWSTWYVCVAFATLLSTGHLPLHSYFVGYSNWSRQLCDKPRLRFCGSVLVGCWLGRWFCPDLRPSSAPFGLVSRLCSVAWLITIITHNCCSAQFWFALFNVLPFSCVITLREHVGWIVKVFLQRGLDGQIISGR